MQASIFARGDRPIRDLPDFHLRWREFRPDAMRLLERGKLDPQEQEILLWLIRMADKIGERDIQG